MKTIDFTSGVNPLGPSNKAKNAIRSHVRHISQFDNGYFNHLKDYIAKKEGIDEACILFGCGSTAILSTLLELTNPRKTLAVYPISRRHEAIMSKYNVEITQFLMKADDNFCLAVDDFCKAMEGCDFVLLTNPHDMTGSVVLTEDITIIVNEAAKRGIYLIIDESYRDYTGMNSMAPYALEKNRFVLLRTFSTFHALGGLRLGYVIASPDITKLIEPRLDPCLINSFAPRAAIASMKDKAYQRRSLLFVEDEKAYLQQKLAGIEGIKCRISQTNILIIQFHKDHLDSEAIFKKYKVSIESFTDENGNMSIRFPVQAHRQNAYFVRILKRIMEA